MKDKLKIKVIIGFVVATLLVLAVSFFTISNFLQLQETIDRLSLPDNKLLLINRLLTDISETETLVRSYSITGHAKYLEKYNKNSEVIDHNLDSLKILTIQNLSQFEKVDSIDVLWNKKTHNFEKYIKLKAREKKRDFSARAIDVVTRQSMDSIKLMRTTKSTNLFEKTQVPEPKPEKEIEEDEKEKESSVFNWVAGIFGNKKDKEKNKKKQNEEVIEEEEPVEVDTLKTIAERQISYDTVIVQEDASKVIDKVVTILEEIKEQESRFSALVTSSEYELLLDDIMIMENIRTMIKQVQMEELQQARQQTRLSRVFAEKSINVIFIVGLAGLVFSAVFIYLIISDITKSNFYKKRLEKAKRKAEKLAKVKEEFLANMSHEIRTPLSAILGFTDQLLLSALEQKQKYYLQAIKNSSVHLLHTVNDILDFSKIEAGKLVIEKLPVKLSNEFEEVIQTFRLKAEEKNIELVCEMDFAPEQVVYADAFRVKQILLNLVSNAIKFTDQGQVTIFAKLVPLKDENLKMYVQVEDSGPGIPVNKLNTIFRGFEQADSSITRKFGGTGLGLAISRRLARLMGGDLSVSSEEGKGSLFTLQLPVQKCAPEDYLLREAVPTVNPQLLQGKSVLVADDDEYNILLFHTILKKWGLKVDLAGDGKEAFTSLQSKKYDIVLTDINMPEMSGIELVNKIREDLPEYTDVPILCITANVFHDKKNQVFDGYILKPFTEQDLYLKMAGALKLEIEMQNNPVLKEISEGNGHEISGESVSLYELQKFADGDWDMVRSMVEDLISNNRLHMLQMNNALAANDYSRVAAIAHKMQPSFAHVNAGQVLTILQMLEQKEKEHDQQQIKIMVKQLNHATSEVFTFLESRVAKMENDGAQVNNFESQ